MLYPKAKQEKLEKELFESPSSEYRGAPFWAWNCELDSEVLKEQIGHFEEMGFGSFHMHARSGMATEYLGKDYASLIRMCTDEAKKRGLYSGLYDEDRFPSGYAGGLLTKDIRYRERRLVFTKEITESVDFEEANTTGKPYLLACYDVTLDSEGYLTEYRLISASEEAKGEKWYAYVKTAQNNPIYNNQAYADTLSREAMDGFIHLTYDFFKENIGDEFGDTVKLIFSDEPSIRYRTLFNFSKGKDDAVVAWTMRFPELFTDYCGLDIVKALPEVFWELPNGRTSKIRYRYYDFLAELFASSCYDNLGNWCEKNGVMLTAHTMAEKSLDYQCEWNSEVMRLYRRLQLPGMDLLCNRLELNTAKQCQSVVHQYGREGMMSELYGVTDWDFDFRGHKFQGDWQAALGVTYRVPHLAWVSMGGEAKRDYPASIGYQSPWYKKYSYIEDHFARVNTALTRGKPVCRIAVIHPIETLWINCGPNDKTSSTRMHRDLLHKNLTEWLLFGLMDFDFIAESLLPELYEESECGLKIGKMSYDTVIVPDLQTIRRTTLEALKKFKEKGGKVIFAGQIPSLVDAEPSEEAKAFALTCENVNFDKMSILNALEDERLLDITDAHGYRSENLIYNMRADGDSRWLFVANALGEGNDGTDILKERISNNYSYKQLIIIKIKGEYEPTLYDTITGEIKKASFEIRNGVTYIPISRYNLDSILLKLDKPEKTSYGVAPSIFKGYGIKIPSFVEYEREEPNVLLIDYAEYSLDGGEYSPAENILRLDNDLRKRLGYPLRQDAYAQPWAVEKEEISHYATLRFKVNTETELKNAMLALENANDSTLYIDGEKIDCKANGFYVDRAISTVPLPTIPVGEHVFEVTQPFGMRVGLESLYLLGDFEVMLKGRKATLLPCEKKIGFGDISKQGMCFYGGSITYKIPFSLDRAARIRVCANHYSGALLSVSIDGKEQGLIVFDPYSLISDTLAAKEHMLEIKVYGNRYNTFGGLHNLSDWKWQNSAYWRTEGYEWTYEYENIHKFGLLSAPVIEIENKQ